MTTTASTRSPGEGVADAPIKDAMHFLLRNGAKPSTHEVFDPAVLRPVGQSKMYGYLTGSNALVYVSLIPGNKYQLEVR